MDDELRRQIEKVRKVYRCHGAVIQKQITTKKLRYSLESTKLDLRRRRLKWNHWWRERNRDSPSVTRVTE